MGNSDMMGNSDEVGNGKSEAVTQVGSTGNPRSISIAALIRDPWSKLIQAAALRNSTNQSHWVADSHTSLKWPAQQHTDLSVLVPATDLSRSVKSWGLGIGTRASRCALWSSPIAWMQRQLECRRIESKRITHFLHRWPCFVISEKLQCRLVLSWRQVCHAYRSYWTIVISAEEHVMHVPHSGIYHK